MVWNKDNDNRARILVNIRAFNIDKIPLSTVIIHNTSDEGHGGSWSALPTF
jgi:hypothetical protein